MADNSKQMLRRKFLKTGCLSGFIVTSPLVKDIFFSSASQSQANHKKQPVEKDIKKLHEIVQKYGSEFGDVKMNVLK